MPQVPHARAAAPPERPAPSSRFAPSCRSAPFDGTPLLRAVRRPLELAVVLVLALAGASFPQDATSSGPGMGELQLHGESAGPRVAPTLETAVQIRVFGRFARTRLTQLFTNPHAEWLHATYVLPLPEGAAVDTLEMTIGDRLIVGELQEKKQAQETFERARAAGQRASLLQQHRANLFRTQIANLGPGDEIRITVEYQETPRFDTGRFSLRLPMVATPRYPGSTNLLGSGSEPGPSDAPEVAHLTHAVLSGDLPPEELPTFSLTCQIDGTFDLEWIDSPSHEIVATRNDGGYGVRVPESPANADFVLHWAPRTGAVPSVSAYRQDLGDDTFVQLFLLPPPVGTRPPIPRRTTYVIDTSGSMSGASMRQAKAALLFALDTLGPHDTFNIVQFNSQAHVLAPAALDSTEEHLERARRYVSGLQADGGTEIALALDAALEATPRGASGQDPLDQIVFLTDGAVSNEDALLAKIRRHLGERRLFTVGIGAAPNAYFMRRSAELGRGTYTFIGDLERVEAGIVELLRKIEQPVLRGLQIEAPPGSDVSPTRLPDLYAGEPLVVTARIPRGAAVDLWVHGQLGDEAFAQKVDLLHLPQHPGVSRAWAHARIRALEDSLHDGADADLVRSEATRTALTHGLVSKYTSLVAVERVASRPAGAEARDSRVQAHPPRGHAGPLPQGSTSSYRQTLLGALLLLTAALGALALRRVA